MKCVDANETNSYNQDLLELNYDVTALAEFVGRQENLLTMTAPTTTNNEMFSWKTENF